MYAFSEIVDRASMFREYFAHYLDFSQGMVGLGACGGLLTHLKNKEIIAEEFPV